MATEAPAQQQMEALLKDKPDWAKVLVPPNPPTVYDPPQFHKDTIPLNCVSWYMQTGACCMRPLPCCCCAQACRYACSCSAHDVNVLDVDEVLKKMLAKPNPNCPERLRGVWWMDGNQINQEVFMTFEDAIWANRSEGVKHSYLNWVRTPTCMGVILQTANYMKKGTMDVHVKEDRKWVLIDDYRIYVLGPEDKLTYPDGTEVPRSEYDMMRYDCEPDGKLTYQYMVRRIAHLDARGNLVKTQNFQRMQEQAALGQATIKSCVGCCNYFVRSSGREWTAQTQEINPWGLVRYAADFQR